MGESNDHEMQELAVVCTDNLAVFLIDLLIQTLIVNMEFILTTNYLKILFLSICRHGIWICSNEPCPGMLTLGKIECDQ